MLNYWLQSALASSGLTQAELARGLSEALKRSVDRAAVNKMASGERRILADELLETARICNFPLPTAGLKSSSDYQRAIAAILPTMNSASIAMPIDISQFEDGADILQVRFADLEWFLSSGIREVFEGTKDVDAAVKHVIDGIKSCIKSQQVFIVERQN